MSRSVRTAFLAGLILLAGLTSIGLLAAARDAPPRAPRAPDGPAWLGVATVTPTAQQREEIGLPTVSGALVVGIISGSPAEKAGLVGSGPNQEPGDFIIRVGSEPIDSAEELTKIVAGADPGDDLTLQVVRPDGNPAVIVVILGELPEGAPPPGTVIAPAEPGGQPAKAKP